MPLPRRIQVLTLYRSILCAHQKHLGELRELGDKYVKSEFRLHKTATNDDQIQQFIDEWTKYRDSILTTAQMRDAISAGSVDNHLRGNSAVEAPSFGANISSDVELSDEQKVQIEKLHEEAVKMTKR